MNNKHWIKNLFGAIAIPLLVAILLQGLCIIKGRTMIANMTSFDNFVVYIAIVMITTIALSINLNSGRFDFRWVLWQHFHLYLEPRSHIRFLMVGITVL